MVVAGLGRGLAAAVDLAERAAILLLVLRYLPPMAELAEGMPALLSEAAAVQHHSAQVQSV